MSNTIFNKLTSMPYIPYNIVLYLAQSDKAEGLWKLLKYRDYNALSKPNLTLKQKTAMLYKDQANQADFSVFFLRLLENEQTAERTILKIYKVETDPINPQISTCAYQFDILCGAKMGMVDYNGIPCTRKDVIEQILISTLNGIDVNGAGFLQFNDNLTRLSRAAMNIGNNTNFDGTSLILGVQVSDLTYGEC